MESIIILLCKKSKEIPETYSLKEAIYDLGILGGTKCATGYLTAHQNNTYTHLPKSMQHVQYPYFGEAVRQPDAK